MTGEPVFRSAPAQWFELDRLAEDGSPWAATTAELDAFWVALYGSGVGRRPRDKAKPMIMGRQITEVANWDLLS